MRKMIISMVLTTLFSCGGSNTKTPAFSIDLSTLARPQVLKNNSPVKIYNCDFVIEGAIIKASSLSTVDSSESLEYRAIFNEFIISTYFSKSSKDNNIRQKKDYIRKKTLAPLGETPFSEEVRVTIDDNMNAVIEKWDSGQFSEYLRIENCNLAN